MKKDFITTGANTFCSQGELFTILSLLWNQQMCAVNKRRIRPRQIIGNFLVLYGAHAWQ